MAERDQFIVTLELTTFQWLVKIMKIIIVIKTNIFESLLCAEFSVSDI